MKKIKLTRGQVALVDDEDFEELNQHKWMAGWDILGNRYYAVRHLSRTTDNHKMIRMHRIIMNTPNGLKCDHIDGNGLNNQKSNLRNCTHAQNGKNRGKSNNNTSGYKGVSYLEGKWSANITASGKRIYLGYFVDKIDAAKAYDDAARKYHGEFARLNFPEGKV